MLKYILITDEARETIPDHPDRVIVTPDDFIANRLHGIDLHHCQRVKVINLCSDYEYMSKGYYCSLLAEARNMRCIPSVSHMIQLNWKRNYQSALPELNGVLDRVFKEPADEPLERTYYVYFGRTSHPKLDAVARRAFDLFRFPLLAIELHYGKKWEVKNIEPLALSDIPDEKMSFMADALEKFTGSAWSSTNNGKKEKYWIGILHDPDEQHPPSDKKALQKFVKAGKELNLSVEFITKHDSASILEYDALFIRETTAINHHTYRLANKAESEGIPVIDDPQSIIRCCNKVFLFELLSANKVPTPKTTIIDKRTERKIRDTLTYPAVLKIPDGAFSQGVVKAENPDDFDRMARELLKKSEIILAQEFIQSDFDWRIGVLNGEAIFACKYFMAKGHWQIYQHLDDHNFQDGDHITIPIEEAPKNVVKIATKAASLIGKGLYGVDLKETKDGVYVIEVNDNPSIDSGVEDGYLGDALYRKIMQHFITLIEAE